MGGEAPITPKTVRRAVERTSFTDELGQNARRAGVLPP